MREQQSIVIDTMQNIPHMWCVIEIKADGEIIYVGHQKLAKAYYLNDMMANEVWRHRVKQDTVLTISILMTGEIWEVRPFMDRHIRSLPVFPPCNACAFVKHNRNNNPLLCSNGVTYNSQNEAAKRLNLNQSHISRHLRNELKHVQGYTFAYLDELPLSTPLPTQHPANVAQPTQAPAPAPASPAYVPMPPQDYQPYVKQVDTSWMQPPRPPIQPPQAVMPVYPPGYQPPPPLTPRELEALERAERNYKDDDQ